MPFYQLHSHSTRHQMIQVLTDSGTLVSKWGGKKESNFLPILQVFLPLNTFVHEDINSTDPIKFTHAPSTIILVPTFLAQCPEGICVKGKFPFVQRQLITPFRHLIALYLGQICFKSLRSFFYVFTKLFPIFLSLQNVLK